MTVAPGSSALNNLISPEAKDLHGLIDQLSSRGVGEFVSLPRLIVVGKQSAGKSSVLEAISQVCFPVKATVCTRFATELTLRRAPCHRVRVSVRAHDNSKTTQLFEGTDLKEVNFPDLISKAKSYMGLSVTSAEFSKDTLRLEVEGPDKYPLTLVDLPGLYAVETSEQSLRGKELVKDLVEEYVKHENTIILVVMDAREQLVDQTALKLVQKYDPRRERTLGIITKPDLASAAGKSSENVYIQVAMNKERLHTLQLGWHILRNRAESERNEDDEDAEVKERQFLDTSAWAAVTPGHRGIGSLRKRLSRVLYDHFRQNLPLLIVDIESKLEESCAAEKKLGSARPTPKEQRLFLVKLASQFQLLIRDAVCGRYSDAFFGHFADETNKLRARLRSFDRVLDYTLAAYGAKQTILDQHGERSLFVPIPAPGVQELMKRHAYNFDMPDVIQWKSLISQLQLQAASNQGAEFPGFPNSSLARELFKNQAQPWEGVALFHVEQVTLIVKSFVERLFRHLIGASETGTETDETTETILDYFVDSFFRRKRKELSDKVQELIRPFKSDFFFCSVEGREKSMPQIATQSFIDGVLTRLDNQQPAFGRTDPQSLREAVLGAEAKVKATDNYFDTDAVIYTMLAVYQVITSIIPVPFLVFFFSFFLHADDDTW